MEMRKMATLVTVSAIALGGCASGSPKSTVSGGSATTATTPGTEPARRASGTATTTDGQYLVTLVVGDRTPAGAATVCAPGPAPGRSALSVTVTVTNADKGRAVPFPPLRIELAAGGAPAPVPVPVRDSSGACTFTPHETAIDAGASVILLGATPAIDDTAAAGSAGRVEVAISENSFTLGVAVP